MVVDTCIGNDKERMPNKNWHKMQTRFLEDFRAAGFEPDKIDAVLCTHLHVDHVGWNTFWDGSAWKPTFPNARYLMAKSEFQYWESHEDDVTPHQVFLDSVAPVVDAGLVDLVEATHEVCRGEQGAHAGPCRATSAFGFNRGRKRSLRRLPHHPARWLIPVTSAVDWIPRRPPLRAGACSGRRDG